MAPWTLLADFPDLIPDNMNRLSKLAVYVLRLKDPSRVFGCPNFIERVFSAFRGNSSTRKTYSYSGVTLIEILVVVGILAVMATLLLPVAQKVLEATRTTHCSSNLRQVAAVLKSYMAENNNSFPPANATKAMGVSWTGLWYAPSTGIDVSPAAYAGSLGDLAKITVCPKNKISGTNYPYCVNYNVMVASGASSAVKYINVNRPSEVVWMADSAAGKDWGVGVQSATSGWSRLSNRHGEEKLMNVLWVDGHVTLNNRDSNLTNNSSFKIN